MLPPSIMGSLRSGVISCEDDKLNFDHSPSLFIVCLRRFACTLQHLFFWLFCRHGARRFFFPRFKIFYDLLFVCVPVRVLGCSQGKRSSSKVNELRIVYVLPLPNNDVISLWGMVHSPSNNNNNIRKREQRIRNTEHSKKVKKYLRKLNLINHGLNQRRQDSFQTKTVVSAAEDEFREIGKPNKYSYTASIAGLLFETVYTFNLKRCPPFSLVCVSREGH